MHLWVAYTVLSKYFLCVYMRVNKWATVILIPDLYRIERMCNFGRWQKVQLKCSTKQQKKNEKYEMVILAIRLHLLCEWA